MKPAMVLYLRAFFLCGLAVLTCDDSTPVVPQEDGVFMISLRPSYREGDEIEILVTNQTDVAKMSSHV